jgi:hypothetical protein
MNEPRETENEPRQTDQNVLNKILTPITLSSGALLVILGFMENLNKIEKLYAEMPIVFGGVLCVPGISGSMILFKRLPRRANVRTRLLAIVFSSLVCIGLFCYLVLYPRSCEYINCGSSL